MQRLRRMQEHPFALAAVPVKVLGKALQMRSRPLCCGRAEACTNTHLVIQSKACF